MQLFKYYNLFSAYKFLKKYAVTDKILRQKDGFAFLLPVENGKRRIHEGCRSQNLKRRKRTTDHLVHCSDRNPEAGDFPVDFYVILKGIFFVFYFQRMLLVINF